MLVGSVTYWIMVCLWGLNNKTSGNCWPYPLGKMSDRFFDHQWMEICQYFLDHHVNHHALTEVQPVFYLFNWCKSLQMCKAALSDFL